ncbi:MAG: HEAT repeat domain-containing protein [Candidatus Neomarinimicrobiota bacterium]
MISTIRELIGADTVFDLTLTVLIVVIAVLLVITIILGLAVLLLRYKNYLTARRLNRLEDQWSALIFTAIDSGTGELPAQTIKRNRQRLFLQYLMRYARRLQGEEFAIIRQLAQPYLPILLERSWHENPEDRARSLQIIGRFGFQDYSDYLVDALDDQSPMIVMIAAAALAGTKYPQYINPILAAIAHFEQWNVSYLAALLARFGPEGAESLRRTLIDATAPLHIRIAGAAALATIRDLSAGDLALDLLLKTADPELQAAALRLLQTVGRQTHLAGIRQFATAPEFMVRANACAALGRIGTDTDIDYLRRGLDDPSNWVAFHAAHGLLNLGDRTTLQNVAESAHARSELARQILAEN